LSNFEQIIFLFYNIKKLLSISGSLQDVRSQPFIVACIFLNIYDAHFTTDLLLLLLLVQNSHSISWGI